MAQATTNPLGLLTTRGQKQCNEKDKKYRKVKARWKRKVKTGWKKIIMKRGIRKASYKAKESRARECKRRGGTGTGTGRELQGSEKKKNGREGRQGRGRLTR